MKALATLAIALAMTASVAHAANRQDFRLVNHTGYDISEVYVSSSKSDNWHNDILGDGTLDDGKGTNIHFSPNAQHCHYDLKVVYTDKDTAEWSDIDLCTVSKITIHYNRRANKTSMETE